MTDTAYIYGDNNGASYRVNVPHPNGREDVAVAEERTHWDPRLEIKVIAGTVQIGIVPPSDAESTSDRGVWNNDDGQFLSLSRGGLNRLIREARACRDSAYGRDE